MKHSTLFMQEKYVFLIIENQMQIFSNLIKLCVVNYFFNPFKNFTNNEIF